MKDANVWSDDYKDIVSDIHEKCDLCKMYAKTPPRPVVAMPMASRFNEKVAMDLKQWGERWILHMIDMWSRLTVSVFIDRKRPSDVIDKVMTHWVGAGFGVMAAIMTDNGGEFSSDEMREVASVLNVELCTTAGYSPFQNGLCERVHAVTDMMLHKLTAQCPGTPLGVLLCWASMARNSLQMWNGYSSYQLVFGQNPNLPNIMSDKLPAFEGSTSSEILAKHLNALHESRRAFIQSEAEERIRRALRGKVRAAEQTFHNGDRVFYKREGKERWLGPGKVVFQDGKVVFVRHGGTFVRVSPNRLIKAGTEIVCDNMDNTECIVENKNVVVGNNDDVKCISEEVGLEHMPETGVDVQNENDIHVEPGGDNVSVQVQDKISLKPADEIRYRNTKSDEWSSAMVVGRTGKASGPKRNWYNVKRSDGQEMSVNLEVMQWERMGHEESFMTFVPKNQHDSAECIKAKHVELEKLKNFATYEEVENRGQMCVSTRWVMCYKGQEVRARLVARGFEEVSNIQRDSPTVGKSAVRLLFAIAASKKWKVKTTDIKSAFLQGKPLDRDVFLIPPPEAATKSGYVWRLIKCLYGLNDAARQFYHSVVDELKTLGCVQSTLDPALFYKYGHNGELVGVLVSHVDDFLHAGDKLFDEVVMHGLRNRFLAGKLEEDNFTYIGFQIRQMESGILLDQNKYVERIEVENLSSERSAQKFDSLSEKESTMFRSMAGYINWIVQGSRPDVAFELMDLSTKFNKGKVCDLLQAVKTIKKIKDQDSKIFFPDLGHHSGWRLLVFTDAAHANLCDGVSSSMAYVIFLVGDGRACCPLSWSANKIKRVVRSTLAAEALSLQEGIEEAVYLKTMITDLLGATKGSFPIVAYVENKSVVEALHTTKMVDDKRLRIDIGAIKQSLAKEEKAAVRWVPGDIQLANCLTKKGASGRQLLSVFHSGKVLLDV